MALDDAVKAKSESPMTDLQFTAYMELRDKYEALLAEVTALRLAQPCADDAPMSDYQFQRYEQIRDKCETLSNELAQVRKENTKLKLQAEMLRSGLRMSKI